MTTDEDLKKQFESVENLHNKILAIEQHSIDEIIKMETQWIRDTEGYCQDIQSYCENSVAHHHLESK